MAFGRLAFTKKSRSPKKQCLDYDLAKFQFSSFANGLKNAAPTDVTKSGNEERGTGNRERGSGIDRSAVSAIKIQKWRTKKVNSLFARDVGIN